MSLSKQLQEEGLQKSPLTIHLSSSEWELADGSKQAWNIEHFPPFVFLKGLGFQRITFRNLNPELLDLWGQRMQSYQQAFIQDPEYLDFESCRWNELSQSSNEPQIECVRDNSKRKAPRSEKSAVPPMGAPLRVNQKALEGFLQEIENQNPEDLLLRAESILSEYLSAAPSIDQNSFVNSIADILNLALQFETLDKAVRISQKYQNLLATLWENEDKTLQLLSAYEPKKSEVLKWNKVFQTLPNSILIRLLQSHISTPSGPQIVRLMNYRTQYESDALIQFCLKEGPGVQKVLLQWLSPYWQSKHYLEILNQLDKAIHRNWDSDIVEGWIQALLRSYKDHAFEDLKKIFKKPSWLKRLLSREQEPSPQTQRIVLKRIGEEPSAHALQFLQDIRHRVRGETADEVERLIQSYQK